ncbi:MAG: sugar phosphate isomerase/epimerase, partial [Mycobacterium sp.]|nr:sugar phosphate isomerase/epimerase [Mycobacterium sp.]
SGWYVMEQDNILGGPPDGDGPLSDVLTSVRFLQGIS